MTYSRIQASLSSIDADAKALNDQVTALTNQIALLDAALAQAKAEGDAKTSEIAALKAEIITLKARIAELTAPPAQSTRLFTTQVPAEQNRTDGPTADWEQGMKFSANAPGEIRAIRYFKAPSESGTHTGRIWSSTGALLASVVFVNETASGWQQQSLATPLVITAGTTYTVSVNARSHYAMTQGGFSTSISNGGLTAAVGAGVYGETPGTFPAGAWENANYFRDVVFLVTGPVVTPPPVTPPPVTPPPVTSPGFIPFRWDDPIFANVAERTGTLGISSGGSASDVSIVNRTGGAAIVTDGSATLNRIRSRTREGYRPNGGAYTPGERAEVYMTNMHIDAYGIGTDHADALQMYAPGKGGRITLKNSYLKTDGEANTPNSAYWSANDWRGAHVLEDVLLSGGVYSLRVPGDGGTSVSLKNVYILKDSYFFGPILFDLYNNKRPALIRWENVRLATIENGVLVPGAEIPQPYGITRDYTNAIVGTNGADVFVADAAKGNTYVGMNGNDTYRMTDYSQSRLSNMDWLTDFSIGLDTFEGPNAQPIQPVVLAQKATAFTEAAIGALLNASGNFPVGGAAIFRIGDVNGERVFLALNNGVAGYSPTEDAIVEITGYSGNLSQFRVN